MSSSETRSVSPNNLSLNERKEDNYRRDTFEDCFCDDLCEEILQYLSLEDKLKLEGVSKQFQRTVFKRQNELYIKIEDPKEHKSYLKNKDFKISRNFIYYYIEDQSLDSFEALLKKCPNITSIQLYESDNCGNYNTKKFNQFFQLIIENCDNLSETDFLDQMNDSIFEEFHRKFGPKMKNLRLVRRLSDLNKFPNIEKVEISEFMRESIIAFSIAQLNLAKLKRLEIRIKQGQDNLLQTVIDTFPTLKSLNIYIGSEDENTIYKPLKNISNLKHLIHFYWIGNKPIFGLLKQMANNCQNLKRIISIFEIETKTDINQLLSQLKAFPDLKRLQLWLCLANEDVKQFLSFEAFKGFANITHLTLCFNFGLTFNESMFKDIDINLQKLQYLEIWNTFDITQEGVTQMAEILSRLSRLQTLILRFNSGIDLKPIEEQITEKCRKIKEINIKKNKEIVIGSDSDTDSDNSYFDSEDENE